MCRIHWIVQRFSEVIRRFVVQPGLTHISTEGGRSLLRPATATYSLPGVHGGQKIALRYPVSLLDPGKQKLEEYADISEEVRGDGKRKGKAVVHLPPGRDDTRFDTPLFSAPKGIRTLVAGLKGPCPRPG